MDVRFAGQPARTDHAAASFGQLLARGVWKRSGSGEGQLEVNAELERSAISEISKLLEGRAIGLHGAVSAKARLSGPLSKLAVTGQVKLDDLHRWNLMPKGGEWQLNYRGQLDLRSQRLELETAEKENPGTPFVARLRVSNLLSDPHWAASLDLREVPAAAVVETARHMGAQLPEGMAIEGKLNGAVGFARPGGLQGRLAASDATVKSPGAPLLKFQTADVLLEGTRLTVGPSTVEADSGQTAELTAEYNLDETALDVQISTAGMNAGRVTEGRRIEGSGVGRRGTGSLEGIIAVSPHRGRTGGMGR